MKNLDDKPAEKVFKNLCDFFFVAFTKTFTVSFCTGVIRKLCSFKPKTLKNYVRERNKWSLKSSKCKGELPLHSRPVSMRYHRLNIVIVF